MGGAGAGAGPGEDGPGDEGPSSPPIMNTAPAEDDISNTATTPIMAAWDIFLYYVSTLKINLPICDRLKPGVESPGPQVFNHGFTFVPQKYIKDILLSGWRDPNLGIVVDVLIDNIVRKSNLLESFCTSDDNLTS